jgi:RNA polymerase sigma-70 factor (ECF subfamily)
MDICIEERLSQLADDVDQYYELLVELYWHQLKAFVLRRTGNPQDAEDIVQDVFVRAYVALERYPLQQRRSLKVRAWLYKIAWNLTSNFASRSPQSMLSLHDGGSEGNILLDQEDKETEHPEDIIEQIERKQELEALVETLPQHYKLVVCLYYFEELKLQEIADILNQPLGTVKVYARRGIQALRKSLAKEINEVG